MTIRFVVLAVVVSAQFLVPYSLIHRWERVHEEGELFRFVTQPIDPVDPFQGRYVALNIEQNYIFDPAAYTRLVERQQRGFALVDVDDDGFARFSSWSDERPANGAYLATGAYRGTVNFNRNNPREESQKVLRLKIPFSRYYMPETKAPLAEIEAATANREGHCWVEVRILEGQAVIEDVKIDGQSLRDLVTIPR
jgi:uncharacterized membrane-anchored protein